ncbi:Hypothetical predicted protein [Cloeon dipterum]|uniref:GDP-Man:Man(3)GlcNAc(2)-PP-Dol alpha-1,2-mannosyltransferase n=1 Tax=Cloeon dipterum TaxID=197152 RepID=A0A8S1E289_9INSE|nr:Hypothetical predicted protein [Cloeon dipterum]
MIKMEIPPAMKIVLWLSLYSSGLAVIIFFLLFVLLRKRFNRARKRHREAVDTPTVAFFHPYCNAGGGGERVLWCAIRAMQTKFPDIKYVVYTGDIESSPEEILQKAYKRFNIKVEGEVNFVYLHRRPWVEASRWPHFTMIGQSIGSMWLAIEALDSIVPDLCIDTMGYAFALSLFNHLGGCKTACYVHYPTITPDMLQYVSNKHRGSLKAIVKLRYYRFFAYLYAKAGATCDLVMANSSWTQDRLDQVWKRPLDTHRVYPPCEVSELLAIPRSPDLDNKQDEFRILSVAQFRPEKDHPMQLRSLYALRELLYGNDAWDKVKLVFAGSCRHEEDHMRVQDLMNLAKHLALDDYVEFKINLSHEDLMDEFKKAKVGLHAMWNEHFGIGVVECMAAGLLTVAHGSGGPLMDIIETAEGSRTGWLATEEVEYARILYTLVMLSATQKDIVRTAARSSVGRFSTDEFNKSFMNAVSSLVSSL